MVIVAMGDSITYGQYLPEGEKPWPALITGYDLMNAGVNSDTTRLALERFPRDVQDREPQAVVIQFGHNDANRWETDRGLPRVSLEAYKANLIEMIDRCRRFDAVPLLCTLTPCHRNERHAEDVGYYNYALLETAYLMKTTVIDVRTEFEDSGPEHLLLDDGLHLNEHGHRLYAVTVQEALDAVL